MNEVPKALGIDWPETGWRAIKIIWLVNHVTFEKSDKNHPICWILRKFKGPTGILNKICRSSNADHLIKNCKCANKFSEDLFSILSEKHSTFHLKILETFYIRSRQPSVWEKGEIFAWTLYSFYLIPHLLHFSINTANILFLLNKITTSVVSLICEV